MSTKRQVPKGTRRRTGTAIKVTNNFVLQFLGVDTKMLTSQWRNAFSDISKREGLTQAVKIAKSWYDVSLRYASHLDFQPIPYRKSDSDGFPKDIKFLKGCLRSRSLDVVRGTLTILQFYKLYDVKGSYSLTAITKPYSGLVNPQWLNAFKREVSKTFPRVLLNKRLNTLRAGLHLTGSNGPNGPALSCAFVDRESIRGTNIESSVEELSSLTGNFRLSDLLAATDLPCEVSHSKRLACHSRIRIKHESGAKARPFAIVDYFTQSSLKPIHDFFMEWLNQVPMDGTRNHSDAAFAVREWTRDPSIGIWSYDLTTATDRFPVFLQEIVVKQVFGNRIGELWKDLIVNRTFCGPEGESIRWEVGQPLGALSSWAVFAVTHHILIQTAASIAIGPRTQSGKLCGLRSLHYRDYRMIGDDISIHKFEAVARAYKGMMTDLGVEFSIPKSVLPEQCSKGPVAELAKRVFTSGEEITPLPPDAIYECIQQNCWKTLIESAWMRGYRSAGSPYTVQSCPIIPNRAWPEITFPFRNRIPQLNGVNIAFPRWKDQDEDPPMGLSNRWFIWKTIPSESLRSSIRLYIISELSSAMEHTDEVLNNVQYPALSPHGESSVPWGGDWQPGPLKCHPEILVSAVDEVREALEAATELLYSDTFPNVDLYEFIGKLHRFLEPEVIFGGGNFIDEKVKTRIFMSKMVKSLLKEFTS